MEQKLIKSKNIQSYEEFQQFALLTKNQSDEIQYTFPEIEKKFNSSKVSKDKQDGILIVKDHSHTITHTVKKKCSCD